MTTRKEFAEMASRTLDQSSCVMWPYCCNDKGYPEIKVDGRQGYAHRYVCELAYGAPPPRCQAAHRCGVRACVNPHHLRWATQSENEHDKLSHGRSNRGERNPVARLTTPQAREIIDRLARGEKRQALADHYGVTYGAIREIDRGVNWRHLRDQSPSNQGRGAS